jgi:4-amino-4-deoxy-L-arabinose transferase-like glycosyltransferase
MAGISKTGASIFIIFAVLSFAIRFYPLSRLGAAWAVVPDSIGYNSLAEGIKAGCGFAPLWQNNRCGPPELERTPGYPFFLAILSTPRAALIVQAILGAVVAVLVGLFVWWQWGLTAGLIAEFIASFDVSSFTAGSMILSDTLFTSIVIFAILLELVIICRKSVDVRSIVGLTGVGLLFAIAALVRPIGQVLLLVPGFGALGLNKVSLLKRIMLCLLGVAIPLAMVLGWSYRNYRQRGAWTFSSISAINLYYYVAAEVLARGTGQSLDKVKTAFLSATGRNSNAVDLWSETFDEDPGEMTARAMKVLRRHPLTIAYITFSSFTRLCIMPARRSEVSSFLGHRLDRTETDEPTLVFLTRDVLSSLRTPLSSSWVIGIRAVLVFQMIVLVFTWIGVGMALWRIRRTSALMVWLILVPLCASLLLLAGAAGPGAVDRYRVPAMPMLGLVAAFGWTTSCIFGGAGN